MRTHFNKEDSRISGTGQFVAAEDMRHVLQLLQELRDFTQSRRSFAIANDLIARLTEDEFVPNLVHDEPAAH